MADFANRIRTRIAPAILSALGVTFLAAGLLSFTSPVTADSVVTPTSTPIATAVPRPTPSPLVTLPALDSSASPTAAPTIPADRVATRVRIAALKIDLPVIAGNDGYPYCDVAMYIDNLGPPLKDLGRPGRAGATYLFAHARDGMFGPIYHLAIEKGQPRKMLGMIVQVYSSDNKLYLYEIREYRLHALDLDTALAATDEELWLQTSEGPKGTPGKTQLRAFLLSVGAADQADAHPKAKPLVCG